MGQERKNIQVKELKLTDKPGTFRAVFATLGVVDKDGDVIPSGAVTNGKKVRVSAYGHSSWGSSLPVGKGVINEVNNELVVDGEFFLNTNQGKDTYETVKGLEDLQEWSFGFDVIKSSEGEQEGSPVRYLEQMDVFEVSPVLLGAGINTRTVGIKHDKSDTDPGRAQGDEEPKGQTFSKQTESVLADARKLLERFRGIATLRESEGKSVSAASSEKMQEVAQSLGEVVAEIERVTKADEEIEKLYLQFQKNTLGV